MSEISILTVDGVSFNLSDDKVRGSLSEVEMTPRASKTYAVGDYLIYQGRFYKVVQVIDQDSFFEIGTNIVPVTVGEELELKASLESPTFSGSPKVPTADVGTRTTQIASTAYVQSELDSVKERIQSVQNGLDNIDSNIGDRVTAVAASTTTAWMNAHITNTDSVLLDTSLTVEGAAADAKAVGDAIDELPKIVNTDEEGADFDLADSDGNVLVRFADGHIKVKNFDSSTLSDSFDEKVDIQQDVSDVGKALVVGEDGKVSPADISIDVDTTLSIEGAVADAKAVGDALDALSDEIDSSVDSRITSLNDDITNSLDSVDSEIGELKENITNLVKTPEQTGADFYICDPSGNVLAEFRNGHLHTKNFDSADALTADDLTEIETAISSLTETVEAAPTAQDLQDLADDIQDVADDVTGVSYGLSKTAKTKATTAANADLDIVDASGNILARFSDGGLKTKNFDSANVTDFLYSLDNRLANPLYETREHYNAENQSDQIDVTDALIRGHTGTTNAGYRIPSITVTNAGTILVAGTHMENAQGDYGDFSIDINRKTANGSWGNPTTVVPFDSTREGYGSVLNNEFLVDRNTGRIYLFYGTEKQCVSWWDVATEDGDFRYIYSDDDGVNWSEPVSLKSLWDTDAYDYCIPSCTKGITLTNGTLVVPCFCKKGTLESARSYPLLLYKVRGGDWRFSSIASVDGIDQLDECAVVEGTTANSIWMYCRPNTNYGTGVNRGYNKFVYNITTDTYTHLPCTFDGNRHCCFGVDRITINTKLIYLMTFTDTNSSVRENITLWASLDGDTWIRVYRMHKASGNGYSVIDNYNGLIAVAYEVTVTGGVIAVQDISVLSDLIYDSATKYIERNISVQDRMQMLFNAAKGIV